MTTLSSPLAPRVKTWEDARLQSVRALGSRAERDRTHTFFAEGLRFVGQAVAQGAHVEAVLVVPKTLDHPFGLRLRRQLEQKRVPIWEVTPELFLRVSRAEEAQWIGPSSVSAGSRPPMSHPPPACAGWPSMRSTRPATWAPSCGPVTPSVRRSSVDQQYPHG